MKKLLSMILALAMLISLIPSVFANGEAESGTEYSGITVKYDFTKFEGAGTKEMPYDAKEQNIDSYDSSYGFWKYRTDGGDNDVEIMTKTDYAITESPRPSIVFFRYNPKNTMKNDCVDKNGNPRPEEDFYVAFELNIPVSGVYNVKLHNVQVSNYGATAQLYIIPASKRDDELVSLMKEETENVYLHGKEFEFCNSVDYIKNRYGSMNEVLGDKYFEAGDYIFAYAVKKGNKGTGDSEGRYMYLKGITLDGAPGDTENYVPMISSLTSTTDEAGVTTVNATAAYMSDASTAATDVTYSYAVADDDADKAEVDVNTGAVTGLATGTATIIATATKNGLSSSKSIEVAVTAPVVEPEEPGEAVEDTNVSIAVQPENTEEGTVSWDGTTIDEVQMGDTVTATATAKEGYVFKYWKNSSGQILSENPNESFVINTNSAITAVFDKIDDTADTVNVELYNANGMPFDSKTVNKDTTFAEAIAGVDTPTYTGFGSFKHWSMYADESKIADDMLLKENTRAVAIFNAPTAKYTVSVNGTAKHSDVLYGTDVTVSSVAPDFSYWKLDDEIVSYNPNYKFTVWADVNLTEVTGEEITEAPIAVLDEVDDNPLLIYSVPAGYTKIEAGILFGSTADISIYSVDGSRAAEARGTGQFTAQPKANSASAYARGYLIFKNNTTNEIRIIYAD